MLIVEELFTAFFDCKTKSFLKLNETHADRSEFLEWRGRILDDYKQKCSLGLQERCNASDDYYLGSPSLEDLKGNQYRIVINCVLQAEHLQSSFHALARLDSDPRKLKPYIPIRFVPSEKIAKRDKLLLAFDALVISITLGEMPPYGRIIHGNDQRNVRIGLSQLMKSAQAIVQGTKRQVSTQAPELRLNKHCGECEFQQQCHAIAVDRDDLSLLSRMTEKEKEQQRAKAILSVTQISYTFRPRRRPKRSPMHGNKHNYALQALAIRERKIHVVGRPELKLAPTSVFIDVEAVPDRDFYYLVGLRITNGATVVQHSYWANESSEEKEIWLSCLQTLAQLEDPQLIHYGSFEATYFKRMIERYGTGEQRRTVVDQVIANSVKCSLADLWFHLPSNILKQPQRDFQVLRFRLVGGHGVGIAVACASVALSMGSLKRAQHPKEARYLQF